MLIKVSLYEVNLFGGVMASECIWWLHGVSFSKFIKRENQLKGNKSHKTMFRKGEKKIRKIKQPKTRQK